MVSSCRRGLAQFSACQWTTRAHPMPVTDPTSRWEAICRHTLNIPVLHWLGLNKRGLSINDRTSKNALVINIQKQLQDGRCRGDIVSLYWVQSPHGNYWQWKSRPIGKRLLLSSAFLRQETTPEMCTQRMGSPMAAIRQREMDCKVLSINNWSNQNRKDCACILSLPSFCLVMANLVLTLHHVNADRNRAVNAANFKVANTLCLPVQC